MGIVPGKPPIPRPVTEAPKPSLKPEHMGFIHPGPTPFMGYAAGPAPDLQVDAVVIKIKTDSGLEDTFTVHPGAAVQLRDKLLEKFPRSKSLEEECADGIVCEPGYWKKTKDDLKKYRRLFVISTVLGTITTILAHFVKF